MVGTFRLPILRTAEYQHRGGFSRDDVHFLLTNAYSDATLEQYISDALHLIGNGESVSIGQLMHFLLRAGKGISQLHFSPRQFHQTVSGRDFGLLRLLSY